MRSKDETVINYMYIVYEDKNQCSYH